MFSAHFLSLESLEAKELLLLAVKFHGRDEPIMNGK